jgi:hypothetical protein
MARRRRGLGSSAAEHAERARIDARGAESSAEDAIHEASGGHCRAAVQSLTDAYRRLGGREAERRSMGHTGAENTHVVVDRARHAFLSHCLPQK